MASQRLTSEDVRRAESLIGRIQGVTSCRIRLDGSGQVIEIHVVAGAGKSPKFIARDVEGALKAGMGIDVDYKKIGVVMLDAEETPASEEPVIEEFPIIEHASRFAFSQVNVVSSREGVRAEVELTRDGAHAFGGSQSDNPAAGALFVVADATLRAVSEFLDEPTRLCLGGVLKVQPGGRDAVLVCVEVVGERHTKTLVGCALVSGDEHRTIVFATLDAVNRLVGKLEFKSSVEYKIK
ncbi:MAG: hypothetical protein OEX18_07220 [Candidatus Krumholzibacteria bacterium]|nr:hypothetical protein [Candidatus Krumholzibacteria bacterium]MDH4337058.1 hypothetical protein [Candidatus Krumholzibacteria bacterium]MDH5268595.1 hypothetical protein [Candidatus Krumholzibacteria bacterium]